MTRLRALPSRFGKPPSRWPAQVKQVDPHYSTAGHREWAIAVKERARWQCEDCGAKGVRLHADHIIERKDGGADLDPANGRARCSSCHGIKTAKAKAERLAT